MHVIITQNWSATRQRLHPQSVAEINHHSVLSEDRIRQCGTAPEPEYWNKDSFRGTHGERVEREPITGFWWQSPQRDPGAKPLVRRRSPPEAESFLALGRATDRANLYSLQ